MRIDFPREWLWRSAVACLSQIVPKQVAVDHRPAKLVRTGIPTNIRKRVEGIGNTWNSLI